MWQAKADTVTNTGKEVPEKSPATPPSAMTLLITWLTDCPAAVPTIWRDFTTSRGVVRPADSMPTLAPTHIACRASLVSMSDSHAARGKHHTRESIRQQATTGCKDGRTAVTPGGRRRRQGRETSWGIMTRSKGSQYF